MELRQQTRHLIYIVLGLSVSDELVKLHEALVNDT